MIKIGKKIAGKGNPCFIIAEAGVNHNGSLNLAKKLVDAAKDAEVDVVKFQTFKAEKLVTSDAEQAKYQTENIGKKESQYAMLKRLELSYPDFKKLKKYCDKKNIIFLSTPHCDSAIEFLEPLVPAYKIGSGDLTNLPFLKKIAQKKKPIILSTGMANLREVKEAVDTILPTNKELILLHCTTNYPTSIREVNLKSMLTMAKEFNLLVGYSDHTENRNVSLAAVALGACVVEKHFTLDNNFSGPDHKASIEPRALKEMVDEIRNIERRLVIGDNPNNLIKELNLQEAMGDGIKRPTPSEIKAAKVIRKSVVAKADIPKGTLIIQDMLTIKRPGTGIEPKHIIKVVGRRAKEDIKRDALLTWQMI